MIPSTVPFTQNWYAPTNVHSLIIILILLKRHQQQKNRADRLLARSTGQAGPSDAELRRNLERTLSNLRARDEIPSSQLYTIADAEETEINETPVIERNRYSLCHSLHNFKLMCRIQRKYHDSRQPFNGAQYRVWIISLLTASP
jgi:hypothetical protein